jgi:hypothetical protein
VSLQGGKQLKGGKQGVSLRGGKQLQPKKRSRVRAPRTYEMLTAAPIGAKPTKWQTAEEVVKAHEEAVLHKMFLIQGLATWKATKGKEVRAQLMTALVAYAKANKVSEPEAKPASVRRTIQYWVKHGTEPKGRPRLVSTLMT